MMKTILPLLALAAVLGLLGGCATPPQTTAPSTPRATCCVCRYNNDLACVDIRVKAATPRTEHQGKTYFFCSADCREAFLKTPEKYLPRGNDRD